MLNFWILGIQKTMMVTSVWVLAIMNALAPATPWAFQYGEIAEAIADASNQDPLFPGEDGARKTAAVLLALAYHESRFQPNVVGDNGASFGLFQIQPPTAKVEAHLLTLPRNAAFIAIGLIRTSFRVCAQDEMKNRLAWYAAGGLGCREQGKRKSAIRMGLAMKLLEEHK